eukprot:gene1326-biopygen1059
MPMIFSLPKRISLPPRSPRGPPVWNLVSFVWSMLNFSYSFSRYARTDRVVMPYTSCGMPPSSGSLPVVKDFHDLYPRALEKSAPAAGKVPAVFSSGPVKMISSCCRVSTTPGSPGRMTSMSASTYCRNRRRHGLRLN